jgi:hypothetical protein
MHFSGHVAHFCAFSCTYWAFYLGEWLWRFSTYLLAQYLTILTGLLVAPALLAIWVLLCLFMLLPLNPIFSPYGCKYIGQANFL